MQGYIQRFMYMYVYIYVYVFTGKGGMLLQE